MSDVSSDRLTCEHTSSAVSWVYTYLSMRLSLLMFLLNKIWSNDFVNMLATFSSSLIQYTDTSSEFITSLNQWILILIYFVWAWNSEFLDRVSDSLKSVFRMIKCLYLFSLSNSWCSHTASFITSERVLYSASVDKRATVDCCLKVWLITPLLKKKT